jgi:glycosyltransferase involved in cell wall biosynthesis
MKISLIIATYNWPEALELSLLSVLKQTKMPYEVIVADDGSKKETTELINKYKKIFKIPLHHVWHKDDGFRLAEIRNKAIKKAKGDFICQIDGDIILHPYYIEDYSKIAKPGFYYRGSRLKILEELSKKLLKTKQIEISFFEKGVENRFNALRSTLLNKLMSYTKKEFVNALGCNMGFWKKDLIAVNGYSNDLIGWGHEDEELCARLINLGVLKKRIKHKAIVYHIFHPLNEDTGKEHYFVIDEVAKNGIIKCKNGLNEVS